MEDIKINFDNFKRNWEIYNGFALIAIVLGVLCLIFPWFRRTVYYSPELSNNVYKSLIDLLYSNLNTSFFGLMYFVGYIFLIFYSTGVILQNHGDFGTPMEKHSGLFFKLSVAILLTFEILMYFHFIDPPYSSSGWFNFFWNFVHYSNWKIHTGFILGAIMICMVIISFIYDQIMLRRHYRNYLPENMPKKYKNLNEFDDELHDE